MNTIEFTSDIKTTAIFSKDKKKRYILRIEWNESKPKACIIMTYPSTADEYIIDQTTMLVRNNAIEQGYGSISIVTASDGIRARIFQITTDKITINAENSDNIKRCVYSNYGHTGIEFVEFIITNKLDSIIEDYEKNYTALIDVYETNDLALGKLTKRILSKLAVILLPARYIRECFSLDISLKNIVKTIIELERSVAEEQDISEKALDCIRQYIATHKSRFIFGCDEWISSVEGKVGSGGNKEIIILKSVVEKVLQENGFENPKMIFQMWSDKKILVREKDRPYKRIRLSSKLPVQPCFVFKITD